MNIFDLAERAPWIDIYDFFASGQPPIIVRLLIFNTLFFILFAVRRARGGTAMRHTAAIRIQVLLIVANFLILFQDQIEGTLSGLI
ncbi:MAG: hypothetical protein FJX63_04505 [Alphaproteobacteria bacterium]|nr:hypothetical protein [Alphaproteobacteria bacterium]